MHILSAATWLALILGSSLAGCDARGELGQSDALGDSWARIVGSGVGGTLVIDGAGHRFLAAKGDLQGGVGLAITDLDTGASRELSQDLGNGGSWRELVSAAAIDDRVDLTWAAGNGGIYLASVRGGGSGQLEVAGQDAVRWIDRSAEPASWVAHRAQAPVIATAADGREAIVYPLEVEQRDTCYGGRCDAALVGNYHRMVARWISPNGRLTPAVDQDPIRLFDDSGESSPLGASCTVDALFDASGTLHVAGVCSRTKPSGERTDSLYYARVSPDGTVTRDASFDAVHGALGTPDLSRGPDGSVDLVWAELRDGTPEEFDEAPCTDGAGRIWLARVAGPGAGGPPRLALTLPNHHAATAVTAAVDGDGRLVIVASVSIPSYLERSGIVREACGPAAGPLLVAGTEIGVDRIVVTETKDGQSFSAPTTLSFPPEGGLTGELDPRALTWDPARGDLLLLFSTSDFDPRAMKPATVTQWLAHLR